MPSVRSSMLDRAKTPEVSPQADAETGPRPVKVRGAGFTPKAGRYSSWIALLLVIGIWQLAGSAGWVNRLFRPATSAIAEAIHKLGRSGARGFFLCCSTITTGAGWIIGTVAGVIV